MTPNTLSVSVSAPLPDGPLSPTTAERWRRAAEADFRLCRDLAERFHARLPRTLRSRRVGWEVYGFPHFALLVPDAARPETLAADEWNFYYVQGESFFRRDRAARAELGMIILADSVEDWAELLRQALSDRIFDVRYTVAPDYLNELGEIESVPSGAVFTLEAYAPPDAHAAPFRIAAAGRTPEAAAREACRLWLRGQDGEESRAPQREV